MSKSKGKKEYLREQREVNKCYLIDFCQQNNLSTKSISEYQIRVQGCIDIYPTSKKYFNLKTKEWGNYSEINEILNLIK